MYYNAVCSGGEGAALKAVGRKRLAGSNPVDGAKDKVKSIKPSDSRSLVS